VALGYRAEMLPEICRVFVQARAAGKLAKSQERVAAACEALLAGFATVGIIALVDEATGFQADRTKDELERILSAYVSPELLPWTRRFGEPFYEQVFRLEGWDYKPPQVKRPKHLAWLTDELIYKKLPEGVRDKLRAQNPPNEKGRRKFKNHQFLTNEIGEPHLQSQIIAVTTLMRASRDKKEFKRLFAHAFPKKTQQLALPNIETDDDESETPQET
jgi:hypothetical protein